VISSGATVPEADAGGESDARLRQLAAFAFHHSAGTAAWVAASGSSMQPLIRAGDELYVEFGPRRYRLGDIVVFPEGGRFVAHRVVGWTRRGGQRLLMTRGDATVDLDRPLASERAFGVVRACRRQPDGLPTPILDRGPGATVIAVVSQAGGRLVGASESLHPSLRRQLAGPCRRVAGASVARLAMLLARPPTRPPGLT
jgi:signal peptidase I